MLRAGVFGDFKDGDTLLIWGDNKGMASLSAGLNALRTGALELFRVDGPADQNGLTLIFCDDFAAMSELIAYQDGLNWRMGREVTLRAAQLAHALSQVAKGHHYLDLSGSVADQVMISVGEYPAEFADLG